MNPFLFYNSVIIHIVLLMRFYKNIYIYSRYIPIVLTMEDMLVSHEHIDT